MGIINFIIVLSILVFVHELGHFLVARYVGVKVNVFSIGFGKRLISKQYKGTLWQFALIPLGGYIQMIGQDDSNPSKIEMSYWSTNVIQHYFVKAEEFQSVVKPEPEPQPDWLQEDKVCPLTSSIFKQPTNFLDIKIEHND